jgi:hypothetical protein
MIDRLKQLTFRGVGELGRCRIQDTLVIAGVPRAGTTWMLELFRTIPEYKALKEPLMYEEARLGHGFGWHKYIEPEEEGAEQYSYLERVLTGQLGISPAWFFESEARPMQLLEHANRRKLVVKFCRLNRMLPWFARRFDVHGLIFVVRHPCAVVASMMRHGEWDESNLHGTTRRAQALHGDTVLPEPLRDPFEPVLDGLETRVGVLATQWSLDHYVPLLHHARGNGKPWILAPYERLVTQGLGELSRITQAVGGDVTPSMRAQLGEPSSSVRDQVHEQAQRQLSKWRRRLSEEEIDRIFEIVDAVGLSEFYDEALEPNYDALNNHQQPVARW